MDRVRLEPDGTLWREQNPLPRDAETIPFLRYQIVLAKSCTLRSFFQMVERYPLLAQLNPYLLPYLSQYRKCPETNCTTPGIDRIELTRTVEMVGFPGDPRMEIYLSMNGAGASGTVAIKSFWLENLLDIPLSLGRLKHVVFGDGIDTFRFDTTYTLFEFVEGVSWELSFHNMPAECRIR